MNLLVVSDLHLNPDSQDRNQKFLEFLQAARDRQDHVLIVGDLFDLWLGWKNLTMDFQKPILKRMHEIAESGLAVDYIEGNRDFGIANYEGKLFQKVIPIGYRTEWAGKKIHLEHGDLINREDRQYRLWRSFSKNPISYFLLAHLPSFLTLRIALRLEKGMKQTNLKNKMRYPDRAVESFSQGLFREGVDLVIVGHFHLEKTIVDSIANRTVLFYNLPGWESGFRYLVIPPDNASPFFRDWGNQNGNSATT